MEVNADDWRLLNQDKYLKSKLFKKTLFVQENTDNDHAHCEFCWAKFSKYSGDLDRGYATLDQRYWICESCFNDFKDMFCWTVKEE